MERDVIGLIPAGGKATRISPLPGSKELFPVGFHPHGPEGELRPKVVSHYLLERMRTAGVTKAFIVIRKGKWDIPEYYGDGSLLDMQLGYLVMNLPYGPPYTLDQAYPFVQHATVAFGFPDILFTPEDAFAQLLAELDAGSADVVLGVFPVNAPQKWDMVDFDPAGRVQGFSFKPPQTHLRYGWALAVWRPAFTEFMHQFLAQRTAQYDQPEGTPPELSVGEVLQAAMAAGLVVGSRVFESGTCLDVGTPGDLLQAIRNAVGPQAEGA
jgi:glucose-1-phosphate thymidylyltransferase